MSIVNISIRIIQFITKSIRNTNQPCYLCAAHTPLVNELCDDCIQELPVISHACRRCARPLTTTSDNLLCGECITNAPAYDLLYAPLQYSFPVDLLITDLKFKQKLFTAKLLGKLLCQALITKHAAIPECVIPVPLHPKRIRQRGYNQAVELARVVCKELQIPMERRLCRRIRNTVPQSTLNADVRHSNVQNAFQISGKCHYRHVAIIDDVVTTGQTVEALTKVLRDNGVQIIQVWSVARA